jgi:CheY-like chemotaxis protein
VVSELPAEKQRMLDRLHRSDEDLKGKAVLVVDDDVRNIFALSSALERRGMTVLTATTGREALEKLESTTGVAIVLMDVMMPEMDGYATTAAIRKIPGLAHLPVIAVTARAMHGDRDKSIAAGATDYVTKPVDTEDLLTVMEVWLGTD